MGVDTSSVAWFGYPAVENVEWSEEALGGYDEPDLGDDAEVNYAGWYDSCVTFVAVPGTVKRGRNWLGNELPTDTQISSKQIAALKAACERANFPFKGEPKWYFTARQS